MPLSVTNYNGIVGGRSEKSEIWQVEGGQEDKYNFVCQLVNAEIAKTSRCLLNYGCNANRVTILHEMNFATSLYTIQTLQL